MEQIMTNNPKRDCPIMTVAVSKAIYRVGIHFCEHSNENLEDKLNRVIQHDTKAQFFCDDDSS